MQSLTKFLLFIFLCLAVDAHAAKQVSCDALNSSTNRQAARQALIDSAHLTDLSGDDDDFIDALCAYPVDEQTLDNLVDRGRVSANEAHSIAQAFDKRYSLPQRSSQGIAYERVNKGLLDNDFCSACSSNLADQYATNDSPEFNQLINQSLAGDSLALSKVRSIQASNPNEVSMAALALKSLSKPIQRETSPVTNQSSGQQTNFNHVANTPKPPEGCNLPQPNANNPEFKFIDCNFKAIASGELPQQILYTCRHEGVALCNSDNPNPMVAHNDVMKTNDNVTVSPVTGQVLMSNQLCKMSLEQEIVGAANIFAQEFEVYSQLEAAGRPYCPRLIDIRKYIGRK